MSTGSASSDAEDSNPCQRRTAGRSSTRRRRADDGPRRAAAADDDEEELVREEALGRRAEDAEAPGRGGGQARLLAAASRRESRQCQRSAANARERARMRVLSKGFTRLKTSLPWVPADTKLSKLDTLRLASSYISHLRQLLRDERFEHSFVHPVNLTWPFVMSGRLEDQEDNSMSSAGRTLCGASA